jgi:chromosomal replication initiator protein
MNAQQMWQAALGQLQLQLAKPTFDTWVRETRGVSHEDGVLVVGVHSAYAKDWLENRLYAAIQRTVTSVASHNTAVRFVVQRSPDDDEDAVELIGQQGGQGGVGAPARDEASRINDRYTFGTFIVGQANRLAHAGSLAVAENPGYAYNPLFIYGGAGLGKTHLLHAIGNRVMLDGRRALYVSSETFANDLIDSIRTSTTDAFRAKYRTIDVLLIDDVQFIINKERTQEEFFHTFNDLYQDNRQIVLSSDRPPKAFMSLEERLRSRFEWGLTADVQAPDLETRMAIILAKAESHRVHLSSDVIEFIAKQVQSNIRELEGALNRVLALARMMDYPLSVQTAERALSDMARPATLVTVDDIKDAVSAYYGIAVPELTGPRRSRDIALARQVVMYLARELTAMSLPQVGQSLGGRDHTTVMYGHDKIAALFEKEDGVRRQVLEVKERLLGSGSQAVQREAQGVRQRHR